MHRALRAAPQPTLPLIALACALQTARPTTRTDRWRGQQGAKAMHRQRAHAPTWPVSDISTGMSGRAIVPGDASRGSNGDGNSMAANSSGRTSGKAATYSASAKAPHGSMQRGSTAGSFNSGRDGDSDDLDIDNTVCVGCGSGADDENMLLCDGCDKGYHIYCVVPKLSAIPDGDWFCTACTQQQQQRENPRAATAAPPQQLASSTAARFTQPSDNGGGGGDAVHRPLSLGLSKKQVKATASYTGGDRVSSSSSSSSS
jgi:hypothetical protein